MKKNLFAHQQPSNLLSLLFLPVIAVFLLPSCCFLGPIGFASQKPCRCRPADSSYVFNPTSPGQQGMHLVNTPAGNDAANLPRNTITLTEQNSPAATVAERNVTPDMPEAQSALSADPMVLPADAQLTYTDIPKNYRKPYVEKKMPLGIKAIKTTVTAGPNLSFKSSKEDYGGTNHKSKPGVGFQFGFGTSYYFSEKFAVAPALLFKNNNATETISYGSTNEPTYGGGSGGTGTTQEYETKYSYSYLSVPILAEFHVNEQLTLMAGPEVNLLLSAHTKSKSGGSSEKTDIKSSSVKTGVGAQVGVKYVIPNTPVGIQLLYDHRISRLNEKSDDTYGGNYETPAWNMKSIQLGITCALCDLLHGGKK